MYADKEKAREYQRLYKAARRKDPAFLAREAEAQKRWKARQVAAGVRVGYTPEQRQAYTKAWIERPGNRARANARTRAWKAAQPAEVVAAMNKQIGWSTSARRLGITVPALKAFYQASIDKTGGRCEVCAGPPGANRLHVDHDHATGALRGVLCHGCNMVLGHAKDNPATLRALALYLERQ